MKSIPTTKPVDVPQDAESFRKLKQLQELMQEYDYKIERFSNVKNFIDQLLSYGDVENAKILLKQGPSIKNSGILYKAINDNNLELIKLILENCKDLNLSAKFESFSPYENKFEYNRFDSKFPVEIATESNMARLLLSYTSKAEGEIILHSLIWRYEKNLDLIKLVLENVKDIDVNQEVEGITPIESIDYYNDRDKLVELLLSHGASLKDTRILHYMVEKSKVDMVKFILDNGKDIDFNEKYLKEDIYDIVDRLRFNNKMNDDILEQLSYFESHQLNDQELHTDAEIVELQVDNIDSYSIL